MLEPYPQPPEMNVRVMSHWCRGIWGCWLLRCLVSMLAVAWMLCLALFVVWAVVFGDVELGVVAFQLR